MARRVQVTILGQQDFQVADQDHPVSPSPASRK
jgi:hypothetical protein